jgi:3-dehydroquinate synthase
MRNLTVRIERNPSEGHDIHIGREILEAAALRLMSSGWGSRYVVLTDSRVGAVHGRQLMDLLRGTGARVDPVEIQPGEASKTVATALDIIRQLLSIGADRHTCLVALGGGVVGDLTGFVASIFMRGIPYVQFPTTLLAQVDSSIGGKTGVDLPEGKNLIGTFYQPKAVFMELSFLDTLPQEQMREGLAEVVKYGLIEDPELLSIVEARPDLCSRKDPDRLEEIVYRCALIKKRFVEMDERDQGVRRMLNFGHTIGHAIEAESSYEISHGEAVSIGMVAEARISLKLGHLSKGEVERIEGLLASLGLPVRVPHGLSTEGILAHMQRDKKRSGNTRPIVLLKRIGLPFLERDVPESCIRETLMELQS